MAAVLLPEAAVPKIRANSLMLSTAKTENRSKQAALNHGLSSILLETQTCYDFKLGGVSNIKPIAQMWPPEAIYLDPISSPTLKIGV